MYTVHSSTLTSAPTCHQRFGALRLACSWHWCTTGDSMYMVTTITTSLPGPNPIFLSSLWHSTTIYHGGTYTVVLCSTVCATHSWVYVYHEWWSSRRTRPWPELMPKERKGERKAMWLHSKKKNHPPLSMVIHYLHGRVWFWLVSLQLTPLASLSMQAFIGKD